MKPMSGLIAAGIVVSLMTAAGAATDVGTGIAVAPVSAPVAARETLRGTVAAVDERNDSITLRLATDVNARLKVRDGLLFNAVRYGDQVEVTVETVDGARTIVGLR